MNRSPAVLAGLLLAAACALSGAACNGCAPEPASEARTPLAPAQTVRGETAESSGSPESGRAEMEPTVTGDSQVVVEAARRPVETDFAPRTGPDPAARKTTAAEVNAQSVVGVAERHRGDPAQSSSSRVGDAASPLPDVVSARRTAEPALATRRQPATASGLVAGPSSASRTPTVATAETARESDGDRDRIVDLPSETESSAPPPEPEEAEADSPEFGTARVTLASGFSQVGVGSAVSMHVRIEGAVDVASVPYHVVYDPRVLEFQGGREGPFLAGDGETTVFMWAPAAAGGRIVVGHSRLGRVAGISGGGELCVLNFAALAPGDARLGFDRAEVIDASGARQRAVFEVVALEVR